MFASCSDNSNDTDKTDIVETDANYVGKDVGNFTADEWYPAGKLGTTDNTSTNSYEDETPSVTQNGYTAAFKDGETVFEHKYTWNTNPYKGLGHSSHAVRASTAIQAMATASVKPPTMPTL